MVQDRQSKIEIDVFTQFVDISGLAIDKGSIVKAKEPAPDIRCHNLSGVELTYELVELLDPGYAQSVDSAIDGKRIMNEHYQNLESDKKKEFDRKYSNADIYLSIKKGTTKAKFKKQISHLFGELLSFPDGYSGTFTTFKDPVLRRLLEKLRISRAAFVGPMFNLNSFSWIGDPTESALLSKFSKIYETDCPLELIAYIDRNIMFPDKVWRPATEDFFEKHGNFGQFCKVWIVDLTKRSIEFEVPAT